MKLRIKHLPVLALLFVACQVEYHPYDTRIEGETDINATHIAQIEEACAGKTELHFAVISDTQRWYDETARAVSAINERNDIDFVLHTGDISDFGVRNEFEWQRDILDGLKVPYIVLLGNHDCIGSGRMIYQKIFGAFDFSFTAGTIHFICVNTNALEFPNQTIPDFEFLNSAVRNIPRTSCHTFVAFHAAPNSEQFTPELERPFAEWVASVPNLRCCLYGHGHSFSDTCPYDDTIHYIQCGHIEQCAYLLFTVNEAGYSYEKVDF